MILKAQKAVLRFGDIQNMVQKIDWNRFKDSEVTYFLFTKLKKDRVIKMPVTEQNETKALKMIETMINYFPVFSEDPAEAEVQKVGNRNL